MSMTVTYIKNARHNANNEWPALNLKKSASNANLVENQGQILNFLTPVKLGKRWAKCLMSIFNYNLGLKLICTFGGFAQRVIRY